MIFKIFRKNRPVSNGRAVYFEECAVGRIGIGRGPEFLEESAAIFKMEIAMAAAFIKFLGINNPWVQETILFTQCFPRHLTGYMWKDRIGKILYPRLREWERRRNVNRIILGILCFIAFLAAVIKIISM